MIDNNQSAHSFYPLKRYWIERGLVFFIMAMFGIFFLFTPWKFFGIILGVVGIWLVYRRDIQPLLQTNLELNNDTISGHINGHTVYLFWRDILVARQTGTIKQGYIQLATRHKTVNIPLELLDGKGLWSVVKGYVSTSALEEDAYQQLPEYQEIQEDRLRQIHTLSKPLKVGYHWGIKVMAWGCLIFSVWIIAELYKEASLSSILILPFVFFVISGLGIYHFSKHIKMDTNTIEVSNWFGQKEIEWAEIQRIEYRISALVFCSNGKKLQITGPTNWAGNDKQNMVDFLNAQIEYRQIETQHKKQRFPAWG
ncbi:MAG: EbsA family protein [Planctomycetes bacterium]|nr:EbsA family protein [Planctomycetota bacterium]